MPLGAGHAHWIITGTPLSHTLYLLHNAITKGLHYAQVSPAIRYRYHSQVALISSIYAGARIIICLTVQANATEC
jgi:uncharacterized membrane protein (UPF0136 family)